MSVAGRVSAGRMPATAGTVGSGLAMTHLVQRVPMVVRPVDR
ncbi:hypothetical protein [Streptomyces resistomycificus]|nr:hypothetical protein [Streptomyces resistomycificus]